MYATEAHESGAELVERHMGLVKRIAYHLAGRLPATVQVEDLVQAGVIGLLEAARNYQTGHGAGFETFAGIRIRGAMLDEVRRGDWAPRSAHRASREISEAIRKVENRQQREASGAEIAQEMGVSLDEYHAMLRKSTEARVFSLEDVFGNDGDPLDVVPGGEDDPVQDYTRQGFATTVAESIAALPEREQLVLSLYYDEELNLKEIGEVLGVTESRVCQIHGQALSRLRARLADWSYAEVAV